MKNLIFARISLKTVSPSSKLSRKLKRNSGFGTVEIVLIIAVLISLALLFRTAITSYATNLITSVFGDQSVLTISDEGDN